jgi:hypothetical protein
MLCVSVCVHEWPTVQWEDGREVDRKSRDRGVTARLSRVNSFVQQQVTQKTNSEKMKERKQLENFSV